MRRILAAFAGLSIVTFLALPSERVLAPGPTASFGNWYLTVLHVDTATRTGAPHAVPADGVFYLITAQTVGRGGFDARVVDARGRAWSRASDVEAMMADGRLVFDVDDDAAAPVLEVRRPGSRRVVEIPLDLPF